MEENKRPDTRNNSPFDNLDNAYNNLEAASVAAHRQRAEYLRIKRNITFVVSAVAICSASITGYLVWNNRGLHGEWKPEETFTPRVFVAPGVPQYVLAIKETQARAATVSGMFYGLFMKLSDGSWMINRDVKMYTNKKVWVVGCLKQEKEKVAYCQVEPDVMDDRSVIPGEMPLEGLSIRFDDGGELSSSMVP